MAFPQVATSATSSRDNSLTDDSVTLPASIAAGDLVMVFHYSDFGVTRTWPGSWVEIKDTNTADTGGVGASIGIAYLIASGGETEVIVTKSIAERFAAISIRINAWHGTTPPEVSTGATGVTANPDPDTVTASWGSADNLFIATTCYDTSTNTISVWPYASNQIAAPLVASAGCGGICTSEIAAGSSDPGTFTITASDEWWAGTLVVRPSAGAPAEPASRLLRPNNIRPGRFKPGLAR